MDLLPNNFRSVPDLKCRLDAMESVLQSVLTGITSKERGEGQVGSPTWQCRQGNTKSSGVTDSSTTPLSFDAATRKNYTNANHSPEITTAQEDTVDGMGLVTFAHEDVSTFFGLSNANNAIAFVGLCLTVL